MIDQFIHKVRCDQDLEMEEAKACLNTILEGDYDDAVIADLLCALSIKGESVSEITGFARGLLDKSISVNLPGEAIDICGTGGLSFDRFNVSTASAFVVASGDIPVIKHGNRGSKKPNGSFDLLESLGCRFDFNSDQISEIFLKTNICFLFARTYHPVMKKVAEARRLAGRRTIFNLSAPLCNPAHPHFQVVGTTDIKTARRLAQVLMDLGKKRGLVVTGEPGIDDISTSGKTHVVELEGQEYKEFELNPSDFGIQSQDYESIPGGDHLKNAEILLNLFRDGSPKSILDLVCVNSGAAFYCFGKTDSIYDGYILSKQLISEGKVQDRFERYRNLSN